MTTSVGNRWYGVEVAAARRGAEDTSRNEVRCELREGIERRPEEAEEERELDELREEEEGEAMVGYVQGVIQQMLSTGGWQSLYMYATFGVL